VKLHPAFDCATQTWFVEVEDICYEASSLRQLLSYLPFKRVKLVGYFSDGWKGRLEVGTVTRTLRKPLPERINPTVRRAPVSHKRPPIPFVKPRQAVGPDFKWTPETDVVLLNFFDQGYSAAQVGEAMGVTRNSALGRWYRLRQKKPVQSSELFEATG
jgi:hypothetical protein